MTDDQAADFPSTGPTFLPAADLREIVGAAIEREGHLLTAGEGVIARRLWALADEPLTLYARLLARVGPVFRVRRLTYALDVDAGIRRLAELDLVVTTLPDDRCAGAFTAPELRLACREIGLATSGTRAVLVERLRGRRWVAEPVVMCCHRALVARLERFYFQRPWMDRTALLLDRLGAVRWASYTPTGGRGLHRDRRAMLTWERASSGRWTDEAEPLRLVLAGPGSDPLSPWRRAVEAVIENGLDAVTLMAVARAGAPVLPRLALALEAEGRVEDALEVCRGRVPGILPSPDEARTADAHMVDPVARIALARTGARLARACGRSWPPLDLRPARERILRLPPGLRGARPSWRVDGVDHTVESAVMATLRRHGREAVHAENTLWTSLYALVFRDLYFLPVPGMLPTARRDGPLDVGTPAFAVRRAREVKARIAAVAAEGCGAFVAAWQGERLAGLSLPTLAQRCASLVPPAMAAAVLGRIVYEGWGAASGLPDLLILPGARTRVDGLIPANIDPHAILVEVKGQGDSLRDGQRVWTNTLIRADIPVELWAVRTES